MDGYEVGDQLASALGSHGTVCVYLKEGGFLRVCHDIKSWCVDYLSRLSMKTLAYQRVFISSQPLGAGFPRST